MTTPITPLENWIKRKIGLREADRLTGQNLGQYQLRRLQETLAYARSHSPFYRALLAAFPHQPIQKLDDLLRLPFTTADDLCDQSLQFLCVSQSDVARVVTLQTWEARPKRLYFTDEDLELTVDFFHHGMSGIVQAGQKVLILMPGERPGSVGDLLARALARMGVQGIVHGLVQDPGRTVQKILEERVDCLVGIPVQVLSLARHSAGAQVPPGLIKSVLLSSDYVAQTIVDEVAQVWGCSVFEHYGMTEMGLGGGVHCSAHEGYHLREADLFFEIIDPRTAQPVSEGEMGEVVFTTLTRRAMPLIRYRTGDLASFICEPCPCGTILKGMDRIRGRLKGVVALEKGHQLDVLELDDVVFTGPGLLDYEAEIYRAKGKDRLRVKVRSALDDSRRVSAGVHEVLSRLRIIERGQGEGLLALDPVSVEDGRWTNTGASKRKIRDLRL
jgi:phenylacetate-coenzyme A ligase PaaK-like adenylate-forming protein